MRPSGGWYPTPDNWTADLRLTVQERAGRRLQGACSGRRLSHKPRALEQTPTRTPRFPETAATASPYSVVAGTPVPVRVDDPTTKSRLTGFVRQPPSAASVSGSAAETLATRRKGASRGAGRRWHSRPEARRVRPRAHGSPCRSAVALQPSTPSRLPQPQATGSCHRAELNNLPRSRQEASVDPLATGWAPASSGWAITLRRWRARASGPLQRGAGALICARVRGRRRRPPLGRIACSRSV